MTRPSQSTTNPVDWRYRGPSLMNAPVAAATASASALWPTGKSKPGSACDQVAGGVALGEAVAQDAGDGVGVVVADPRLHRGVDRPGPVGVDGHAGARELGGEVDRVALMAAFVAA
jgi:hypothetical protein